MGKRTIVVSAFPACGKSYIYNHYNGNPYTFLDSDSSQYSWIYKDGVKTSERNPNFISDYISHIKENIGKVDCIFVSSHREVRQALRDNGIKYFMVYPSLTMRSEMIKRMRDRGNTEEFIKFQDEHFEEFVAEIMVENKEITDNAPVIDYIHRPACYAIELNERFPYISMDIITYLLGDGKNDIPKYWWNY